MNLPATIDVALGLIVLSLLLSTVCSFAVELIATWRWWRKRLLHETIGRLITGLGVCKAPSAPIFPNFDWGARFLDAPTPPLVSNSLLFSAPDIKDLDWLVERLKAGATGDKVSESGTLPARNSCLFTGENAAFEPFLRELKDADCFLRILYVSTITPYASQFGSFVGKTLQKALST